MKPKTCLTSLALLALAAALLAPRGTHAQADSPDARATAALVSDVIAQQKTIAENQAKIDEKLAAIGEDLRVARIFESRAGGGHKAK